MAWQALIGMGAQQGGEASSQLVNALTEMYVQDYFNDANATTGWNRNQDAMALQYAYNSKAYQQRYQNTVADMKAAGLNPILAATGGFSVGNAPSVGLPNVAQSYPVTSTLSSSAKGFAEAALSDAERSKTIEETKKVIEETAKVIQDRAKSLEETLLYREQQRLVGAQEREMVERVVKTYTEVGEISARIQKTAVEMSKLESDINLNKEQVLNLKAERQVMSSQVGLLDNKAQEALYALSELARTSEVYEGPAGKIIAHVKEIMRAIGIIPAVVGYTGGRLLGRTGGSKVSPGQSGIMD